MVRGVQSFLNVAVTTGLLILGIAGTQAKAALVGFGGDTNDPTKTWNRPNIDPSTGLPTGSLSGTNVPYSSKQFSVDATGFYRFLSISQTPPAWDNFTFLYQNSFDPTQQITNLKIGNDDFTTQGRSGFDNVSLTANTQYFFVTTGSFNTDKGTFFNTIDGSGTATGPGIGIVAVPFEFSPGLGISILGAWFGISQLKSRMGKNKSM